MQKSQAWIFFFALFWCFGARTYVGRALPCRFRELISPPIHVLRRPKKSFLDTFVTYLKGPNMIFWFRPILVVWCAHMSKTTHAATKNVREKKLFLVQHMSEPENFMSHVYIYIYGVDVCIGFLDLGVGWAHTVYTELILVFGAKIIISETT